MSSLAWTALTVLQVAGPGGPSRAVLAHQLDSVRSTYGRVLQAQERALPWRPSDTVRAGALVVALPARVRRRFEPAIGQVSLEWQRLFGAVAPRVILSIGANRESARLQVVARNSAGGPIVGASADDVDRWSNGRTVRRVLWQALGGVLLARADSALAAWLPIAAWPLPDLYSDDDLAYQFVSSAGIQARACREGRRDHCGEALGLEGPVTGELTIEIRNAVLASAVGRRGDGAWSLLEASRSLPLRARLESVAGEPVGALVAEWQSALDARRQAAGSEESWRFLAGCAWGLALMGLALGLRRTS